MVTPEKKCEVWAECFSCVGSSGEFSWPEIVDDRWEVWPGFCFIVIAFGFDCVSIFLPVFESRIGSAKLVPHVPSRFVVLDYPVADWRAVGFEGI